MKRILFITTGGTISCVKTQNGLEPKLGAEILLKSISREELGIIVEYEEPFLLDSTDMVPEDWVEVAKLIQDRYDIFDGFVVTHGTDTLAYGAAALSVLIQNSPKPIAITGSMSVISDPKGDAIPNLRAAFQYVTDPRAFGIKVVFGGRIIEGYSAVKVHSSCMDAFRSMNVPETGTFDEKGIHIKRRSRAEIRLTWPLKFYYKLYEGVYVAKIIPGLKLKVPLFETLRAVIVETYGTGGVPPYCEDEIYRLCHAGVYVIIATQCAEGGTSLKKYSVGRRMKPEFPLMETKFYTIEYAVAKAQLALAYSRNYEGFRQMFERNFNF